MKYRHLGRKSSHRQALLRNLVTSLFTHESITTTWPKAKEAQRLAEKLITLGKKNTEESRNRALTIFYTPKDLIPKLFGPLRERYANRPGGYTRVLHIEPLKPDQAPSAILELVDGPKDIRFAMTAKIVSRLRREGKEISSLTNFFQKKVTRFRPNGQEEFQRMVEKLDELEIVPRSNAESKERRWGGQV